MNPLAARALLSRSRWLLYLLMLLFWVVALPLQAATLNIAKPGSGSGTVASNPAAISCGADCTGSYGAGTGVTLIATPDAASSFVGWAAGICAGQNRVCALNMTATNQTVAAYFAGASVATGSSHNLALKSDGTVWAWGRNYYGQLGDGSTTDRSTPVQVQVSGLSDVIALAGRGEHSLALKSDGTVWAWGASSGDPSLLSDVIAIAAGDNYGLALKSDGTVWAWGKNYYGQLGNGSTSNSSPPVQVSGMNDVIALAAGDSHTLALKSDGTVWAWGYNGYGQLGNGSTTSSTTPVPVSGLTGVIALAAGDDHSLALKSDGTVWAWGLNNYGQLGDGSTTHRSTPVQVSGRVIAIAAGGYHSLALKSDGAVWAWGNNQLTPVQVSGLSGVIALAAGSSHTLALKSDGTVWAWGSNYYGQLGDGSTTYPYSQTPVQTRGAGGVSFLYLIAYRLTVSKAGTGSGTVTSNPAGISCGTACTGSYGSGTSVTLTATAASGSTFTGWSGACTGTGSCTVSMNAAKAVTATFNLPRYTLTVNKAGTGSGTVASYPAGISCGADCSESYTSGTSVTLTATAASGWAFAGWGGPCTGMGSCTVSMSAARSVTATFLPGYTLTVSKAGTGAGTVASYPAGISCGADCIESYTSGTSVTLTASAASGSTFTGWSGACGGTSTCTVSMSAARAVTATFLPNYTLTVSKAGTGSGTVVSNLAGISCGTDCSEPYTSGTSVTLTATAASGSTFTGWSGACTGTGSCTVSMSAARTVTATFNSPGYALTVGKAGTGSGTVVSYPAGITCGSDCSEFYTNGTSVTLIAIADTGSTFDGWSGACTGTTSTCTVSMSAARSVTANFSPAVASRQINIATRGWAGTGDSVMIAGFVISGTQPKKVLITAKGPVLATAGVPSVLSDPNLTLYNSAGQPFQFNDNWQSASNASEVAALGRGMRTDFPQEAALLTTLVPGAYTAIVRGAGTTTGNALVEVFDEDSSSTSKLSNIATRGWAGTGDSVMIAGFVISGSQSKKVLITAKGPVLATVGVPDVLGDPNLTLYNSAGQPIEFNEDWQSASNASEVDALGRGMRTDFPQEAALLTTLDPGAYTAIVRGAGVSTGNALVEVFDQD